MRSPPLPDPGKGSDIKFDLPIFPVQPIPHHLTIGRIILRLMLFFNFSSVWINSIMIAYFFKLNFG